MKMRLVMGLTALGILAACQQQAPQLAVNNTPAKQPKAAQQDVPTEERAEPEEVRPGPGEPVKVRFDAVTGCWPAKGWSTSSGVLFDFGTTGADKYLLVQMLPPEGSPDTGEFMAGRFVTLSKMEGGRVDVDLSSLDGSQNSMVAKVTTPGQYEIGIGPTAAWGSEAKVKICRSAAKPKA
jgi:hypothetical protein